MPDEWFDDPGFYPPEPQPEFRRPGGPPGLPFNMADEMQYEPAPYLPPQQPGMASRLLAPFSGLSYRSYGNAPAWPGIAAGLLSMLAQSRQSGERQIETGRQEVNERAASGAAWRNQRNLEATRTWLQQRASRASEKRGEERTVATEDRAATRKRLEADAALETGGLPIQTPEEAKRFGRPVGSRMSTEAWRAAFPDRYRAPRPQSARIGPVLPSLSAASRDLLGRSATSRATGYQSQAADSLQGLAAEVDRIHSELREAQSPEEVDAINTPDGIPREMAAKLAAAARLRKAQLGNAGRPATR
jgi:hypothetical protein